MHGSGQEQCQILVNTIMKKLSNKKTANTGCFIMYSGITKIYYRKTAGHVFTKPVQIEGTTQEFFFSSKLFFIVVHTFSARRCEFM